MKISRALAALSAILLSAAAAVSCSSPTEPLSSGSGSVGEKSAQTDTNSGTYGTSGEITSTDGNRDSGITVPSVMPDFHGCNPYIFGYPLSESDLFGDACGLVDAINGYGDFYAVDADTASLLSDNIFFNYPPAALCEFKTVDGGISITYSCGKSEFCNKLNIFFAKVRKILDETVSPDMPEVRIALELYRYVTTNVSYFSVDYTESQTSAYSALTSGRTICYGFADAYNYLLRQSGISAELVFGERNDGEKHGWSLVTIGGNRYHCDPTWEKSSKTYGLGLLYFGMTDDVRLRYTNKNAYIGKGAAKTAYGWNDCTDDALQEFGYMKTWTWEEIEKSLSRMSDSPK